MKEKVRRLSKRIGLEVSEIGQVKTLKGDVIDIPLFINGKCVLKEEEEGKEEESKEVL
jgi:hypothetical protein